MRKFQVTQEDIDQGLRGNPSCCPVALSICRGYDTSLSLGAWVRIGRFGGRNGAMWQAALSKGNLNVQLALPLAAIIFINDFDRGKPVSPFEFEAEELAQEVMFIAIKS